jgi:hypothetical protein
VDVVQLLVERLQDDTSSRVRRAAAHQLGLQPPDSRAVKALEAAAARASDERTRAVLRWSLQRQRAARPGARSAARVAD